MMFAIYFYIYRVDTAGNEFLLKKMCNLLKTISYYCFCNQVRLCANEFP